MGQSDQCGGQPIIREHYLIDINVSMLETSNLSLHLMGLLQISAVQVKEKNMIVPCYQCQTCIINWSNTVEKQMVKHYAFMGILHIHCILNDKVLLKIKIHEHCEKIIWMGVWWNTKVFILSWLWKEFENWG